MFWQGDQQASFSSLPAGATSFGALAALWKEQEAKLTVALRLARAHGAEQGRRLKEEQARRSALQGELDEVKEKLREKAAPAVDADDEDEDEDEFEDAEEADEDDVQAASPGC